jgi:hypothetical protein
MRFVQVGSMSGADITLPGALLRAKATTLMGSGVGSVPVERLVEGIGALLRATVSSGFKIAAEAVPLSEVERAWAAGDSSRRIVLTMGSPAH